MSHKLIILYMTSKKSYNLNNTVKKDPCLQSEKRLPITTFVWQNPIQKQISKTRCLLTPKNGAKNILSRVEITQFLGTFVNKNGCSFLDSRRRFQHKKIQTHFRSIISDQKKRAAFAQHELKSIILKTLLTVNHKTFVNTLPVSFCSAPAFRSLAPFVLFLSLKSSPFELLHFLRSCPSQGKDKGKRQEQRGRGLEIKAKEPKAQILQTFALAKAKEAKMKKKKTEEIKEFKEQEPARHRKNNRNSQYATLGPALFLEKSINPVFTRKTKSFSRIRNRCLLTGRSTIIGKYRLSRISFRQYAGSGQIPGLIKDNN